MSPRVVEGNTTLEKTITLILISLSFGTIAAGQAQTSQDSNSTHEKKAGASQQIERRQTPAAPSPSKLSTALPDMAPRLRELGFKLLLDESSSSATLVQGAPYSAVATTETVQTLADGSQIVYKSSAKLYRDSEGRTRREQTFEEPGKPGSSSEPLTLVLINDSIAGKSYILDTSGRVAWLQPFSVTTGSLPPGSGTAGKILAPSKEDATQIEIQESKAPATVAAVSRPTFRSEHLGNRTIEGVEIQGRRTTVTFPADAAGKNAGISIVTEKWFSPDLKVLVLMTRTDPHLGEETYALTSIDRSEPPGSLFKVPPEYSIKEPANSYFFGDSVMKP